MRVAGRFNLLLAIPTAFAALWLTAAAVDAQGVGAPTGGPGAARPPVVGSPTGQATNAAKTAAPAGTTAAAVGAAPPARATAPASASAAPGSAAAPASTAPAA